MATDTDLIIKFDEIIDRNFYRYYLTPMHDGEAVLPEQEAIVEGVFMKAIWTNIKHTTLVTECRVRCPKRNHDNVCKLDEPVVSVGRQLALAIRFDT